MELRGADVKRKKKAVLTDDEMMVLIRGRCVPLLDTGKAGVANQHNLLYGNRWTAQRLLVSFSQSSYSACSRAMSDGAASL